MREPWARIHPRALLLPLAWQYWLHTPQPHQAFCSAYSRRHTSTYPGVCRPASGPDGALALSSSRWAQSKGQTSFPLSPLHTVIFEQSHSRVGWRNTACTRGGCHCTWSRSGPVCFTVCDDISRPVATAQWGAASNFPHLSCFWSCCGGLLSLSFFASHSPMSSGI